jgi:RNA polymerase sigma-70 factor (ECF subfamily)
MVSSPLRHHHQPIMRNRYDESTHEAMVVVEAAVLQENELMAVVAAARQGEANAMDVLYTSYADAVRRYCYVRLRDIELADDCVQETFVRVWSGLKTFDYRNSLAFTAWLYTIARNVVVNCVRQRQRLPQVDISEAMMLSDVTDTAQTVTSRITLRDAIKMLSEEQQMVISMRFFGGLLPMEIAEATNRTVGSVKALQHRALKRLAELLTESPQVETTQRRAVVRVPELVLA